MGRDGEMSTVGKDTVRDDLIKAVVS